MIQFAHALAMVGAVLLTLAFPRDEGVWVFLGVVGILAILAGSFAVMFKDQP